MSVIDRNFRTPGGKLRGRVRRPNAHTEAMARTSAGSPADRQTGVFISSTLRNFLTGTYRPSSSAIPNRSLRACASALSFSRTVFRFIAYSPRGVTTDTVSPSERNAFGLEIGKGERVAQLCQDVDVKRETRQSVQVHRHGAENGVPNVLTFERREEALEDLEVHAAYILPRFRVVGV